MPGVAIVTGAGSGLGRQFARSLAGDGFAVGLLGRTEATLEETAASGMSDSLVLPTDITSAGDVTAAFKAIDERWGRVDVLVNNAGTFGPTGEPDEISVDEWAKTLAVNVTGGFLCARAAFARMKLQHPHGGRIVNIGSISAHIPRPRSAPYAASKQAITGLSKALALDGRPHNIAVTQIDIGNADTVMTREINRGVQQSDGSTRPEPTFEAVHAADVVLQVVRLPLDVSMPFLTMVATGMPYAGRG